jgi:hypothetical protein
VVIELLRSTGGGVICGLLLGALALLLAGRARGSYHLVEITVTTVAAYGSFLLADRLQVSGVLATITAGLLMGNFEALGRISRRGKDAVADFWEYGAFVANSFIFLLIGMYASATSSRAEISRSGRDPDHIWCSAGRVPSISLLPAVFCDQECVCPCDTSTSWSGVVCEGLAGSPSPLGYPREPALSTCDCLGQLLPLLVFRCWCRV